MIEAIAYALALMHTQPVFCRETLVWEDNPLAVAYSVAVSFEGPDKQQYIYTLATTTNEALLLAPYGRKCIVTVGAVYVRYDGDVYTLTSEPFEFEGCASKRKK
jgi:hypothetical protein